MIRVDQAVAVAPQEAQLQLGPQEQLALLSSRPDGSMARPHVQGLHSQCSPHVHVVCSRCCPPPPPPPLADAHRQSMPPGHGTAHPHLSSHPMTAFAVLLKVCSGLEDLALGVQIHGLAVKTGLEADVRVGSSLVDMYGRCRSLQDAMYFFHGMGDRNCVSWGAAIAGCVQNEQFARGLELFVQMQRMGLGASQPAYASAFRSCSALSCLSTAWQLHAHAIKNEFSSDRVVGTAIVDVYAKAGSLVDARKAFFGLSNHTVETCNDNAMMVGLVRTGLGVEAMQLFQFMTRSGIGFDVVSLPGFDVDVCVRNAILDLYGRCKALAEAYCTFQEMEQRYLVSWNAIIAALEKNDCYEDTIAHLNEMLSAGMEPDDFTYGSVFKACAGLQSLEYGLMVHNKVIKSGLGLDAFVASTVVDMYCKCVMITEVQKLHDRIGGQELISWNSIISGFSLNRVKKHRNAVIWKTLLSICKIRQDVEVTEISASNVLGLDPDDSSVCILLSNVYAQSGKRIDVSRIRKLMSPGRLKKEPGCSWIEMQSEMHGFLVGDKVHPRSREVYGMLNDLIGEMKLSGYEPASALLAEVDEEGSASEQDDLLGIVGD
ncbi:hypothetical protein HU200_018553 [Digitaria exilis]|uniref:Pentatricopeptide repeat-containing protein n=1 Tax=Digitaria exilis TaxID=1010633 RepID=A0A835F4M9_9POAL|nr:hypothetical protein HU200_018553 [Digitaria exilis]